MRSFSGFWAKRSVDGTANLKEGHALTFISLTMAIDMAGVGIIIPVMPSLIESLGAGSIGDAARIGGWLVFVYAGMQFFMGPVAGALGDCFGRRPVLLAALAGLAVDYFVMALAPTLLLLFISRAVAGVLGATWPVANAYVADISAPEKRARNFGVVSAAGAVGLILGPALGGVLGEYGVRLPFIAAGVLTALNAVYGFFVLPESLRHDDRRGLDWKRANPLGGLLQIRRQSLVLGVLTALFFMQLATQALVVIWAYFTIERFGWTPMDVGLSVTFYAVSLAFVQGALTGPMVKQFGEVSVIFFGLVMGLVAYVIFAFATTGWMMYAGIAFGVFGGLITPSMQSIMTHRVPANAQGELQGAITSVLSVTVILGPLIMTQLFARFTTDGGLYFPGAPFLASAALVLICGLVFSKAVIGKEVKLGHHA